MTYRRTLHLRHPDGFTDEMFARFQEGCLLFQKYVETVLDGHERLGGDNAIGGEYIFGTPILSEDRRTASLPINGVWTLGSRNAFENGASYLLREFVPLEFKKALQEGLTESVTGEELTNWREVGEPLERLVAHLEGFPNPEGTPE